MDRYINSQLATAKELLETGVQLNRPLLVQKSIKMYVDLRSMIESSNEEASLNVVENMVRACSAMCVFDGKNALSYMQTAEKFKGDHPDILNNLGYIYHTQFSNWDKSIQYYQRCLEESPRYVTAYLGIIDVYRSLRHHTLELQYAERAREMCKDSPEVLNSLGLARLHVQDFTDMSRITDCFNMALAMNCSAETRAKVQVNLGHVAGILGDFSGAMKHYLASISADKNHSPAYGNILLNLHYYSDEDLFEESFLDVCRAFDISRSKRESMTDLLGKLHIEITNRMYGDAVAAAATTGAAGAASGKDVVEIAKKSSISSIDPSKGSIGSLGSSLQKSEENVKDGKDVEELVVDPDPVQNDLGSKIVLGYVTSDLIDHAVSFFSSVLFHSSNKNAFDVFIYSNNIYDAASILNIPCKAYRCIKGAKASDVAQQIKKDAVDILIDLSGHTSGNRLDVFAERPAKILLSYLGYPDDTGFPFMRRISDNFTEKWNVKRYLDDHPTAPIRLERLFLCYTPKSMYEQHVKSYTHFKPSTSMVNFGCFAKLQKVNKHVIATWCSILEKVPNARIILKSRYFQDEKVSQMFKDRFGVNKNRVVLLKGTTSAEKHMELYKILDIHLDTFPYAGTTITTESLFMNVPVITLAPERRNAHHVQRVSGSILTSMGLADECVARTKSEYIQKAVNMVRLLPHLPSVRKRFLSTDISQKDKFMKRFEKMLVNLQTGRETSA
jgi:predicted O-linked N-acetylglucosamine transferase (SPINDLY family)